MLAGTISRMRQGAVRVRLDVTDIEAGMLLRATGARRFAHNWAIVKIKANADPGSVRVRHHERIEALDSVRSV